MPRYTLTLIDSTNQTPPIVPPSNPLRTIIRQLTKRLDPRPNAGACRARRIRHGARMRQGVPMSLRPTLRPEPPRHRVRRHQGWGGGAQAQRKDSRAPARRRLAITPPTVAEWCTTSLNDICKPPQTPHLGQYCVRYRTQRRPPLARRWAWTSLACALPPHGTLRQRGAGKKPPAPRAAWRTCTRP